MSKNKEKGCSLTNKVKGLTLFSNINKVGFAGSLKLIFLVVTCEKQDMLFRN